MLLSLSEFRSIGREHRHTPQLSLFVRAFTWLFGPVGLHSRIRAGHVIREVQQLDLPRDARVLDAGCGRGLVLFWLATRHPHYHLRGIELNPVTVARNRAVAQKMGLDSLTFEQGDLLEARIGRATYDLIVSIDVLEHIADDVCVLRNLRSALKPDGTLLLHLPLRHQEQRRIFSAFKNHTVDSHVRDEYLPEEVRDKLEATGFEIGSSRYGFGWQGELAFELNNLFWDVPFARAFLALLTYPIAWFLAYRDVGAAIPRGNSLVIQAGPKL